MQTTNDQIIMKSGCKRDDMVKSYIFSMLIVQFVRIIEVWLKSSIVKRGATRNGFLFYMHIFTFFYYNLSIAR